MLLLALPHCLAFRVRHATHPPIHEKRLVGFKNSPMRVGPGPFLHKKDKISTQQQSRRPFFFNREAETAFLTRQLYLNPMFSVVVGPPSCGKSALINHVLDHKLDDGRDAILSASTCVDETYQTRRNCYVF